MYQCHIQFYLAGGQCSAFEVIKGMPALEHFVHEFWESDEPQAELMAKADVIFMNLQDKSQEETLTIRQNQLASPARINLYHIIGDNVQKDNTIRKTSGRRSFVSPCQ